MTDEARSWLEELETAVRQAAETIDVLRQERDELAQRVQELDARVGELEAAGAREDKGPAKRSDEEATAPWPEEREEIRRRVERLTERLEGLLEET